MTEIPPHLRPLHGISQPKPAPPSHPAPGAGSCPSRNGELPLAVPADRCDVPADRCDAPSRAVIERLQAKIRAIERSGGITPHDLAPEGSPQADRLAAQVGGVFPRRARWTLGAVEFDAWLGTAGLDPSAIHEIKPGPVIADWAAAAGFVLRLAVRRLRAGGTSAKPRILWCATDRMIRELGGPHGAGLLRMGLDPGALILVEAGRTADLLWAMEEGLKSRSLLLAIGFVDSLQPVPARRLSLAAEAGATPVLLLTHPAHAPAAATATRWRISAEPGAPHPLDARAPGATRFGIALERCRAHPLAIQDRSHVVEWSDETFRFHMASGLADRAQPPPHNDTTAEPGRRATG